MTSNRNYMLSLLGDVDSRRVTWTAIKLGLLTWGCSIVPGFIPVLAKQSPRDWLSTPARLYIRLFRSIPLLVLLTFVYNMPQALPSFIPVLSDPFQVSLLAMVSSEAAYIAEIHRGELPSIPRGQGKTIRALGLHYAEIQWRVITLQMLRVALSALVNGYITIVKFSSLVSVISLTEILMVGQQLYSQNFLVMETTTAVVFYYIFIVTAFDFPPRWPEDYLDVTQRNIARSVDVEIQWLASARRSAMMRSVAQSHEPAPQVFKLCKAYNSVKMLGAVSLQVRPGKMVSAIDPLGSGKTTLIRLLNGFEQIDNGETQISGQPLIHPDRQGQQKPRFMENTEHRLNIGMVSQSFNLFPYLTVFGNLLLAPRYYYLASDAELRQHACELLHKAGMLEHVWKHPHQLSGGQQQRIVIACALVIRPQIMLFDEPTSALNPERVSEMLQIIESLAHGDTIMVIVTHEVNFTFKVPDRIMFMEKGRMVYGDTPQAMRSGQHPRVEAFLEDAFLTQLSECKEEKL